MSNTKIVVFQMKEIIYTVLFLLLGILFVVILIIMFRSGKDKKEETDQAVYKPGVYSSECKIGNTTMNVSIVVDEDHINAVELKNLNESITTMFPLVESSVEDIESSLKNGVDIDDIQLSEENRYTKVLLLEAVESALNKARIKTEREITAQKETTGELSAVPD